MLVRYRSHFKVLILWFLIWRHTKNSTSNQPTELFMNVLESHQFTLSPWNPSSPGSPVKPTSPYNNMKKKGVQQQHAVWSSHKSLNVAVLSTILFRDAIFWFITSSELCSRNVASWEKVYADHLITCQSWLPWVSSYALQYNKIKNDYWSLGTSIFSWN